MPRKDLIELLEHQNRIEPSITRFITPITDNDHELFRSYIYNSQTGQEQEARINFENSFEYIRMYFCAGRYQGYKYYDNECLVVIGLENKKKPHFKIFKPLGKTAFRVVPGLVAALSTISQYPIQVVCLGKNDLKNMKRMKGVEVKNIKEFNYYLFNLEGLDGLRGVKWKNVRQKITAFEKMYAGLEHEPLGQENVNDVVHFIGAWRRQLLTARGLSFANLEKNKFAAKYYADKNDMENIWSMVYRLSRRVVAFQLLYRLGQNSAAHAIGMADVALSGLSEAAQMDIWTRVYGYGIRYINDGPSWRQGLERYKRKFNPIGSQTAFECKVTNNV